MCECVCVCASVCVRACVSFSIVHVQSDLLPHTDNLAYAITCQLVMNTNLDILPLRAAHGCFATLQYWYDEYSMLDMLDTAGYVMYTSNLQIAILSTVSKNSLLHGKHYTLDFE